MLPFTVRILGASVILPCADESRLRQIHHIRIAHADRNEVRAVYNRADYLLERTRMMQDWADHLDAVGAGDYNHVISGRFASIA